MRELPFTTAVAVRAMNLQFLHPLTDDKKRAEVSVVVCATGHTSFTVTQEARNETGLVCATSEAVLVALDLAAGTARPLSKAERGYLTAHRPAPHS
ncbi:hotdog domain-containing protein [Streptomyces sp. NPDC021622]|uniref:acyl-CoA thioesterase n=1 Tax=Streptomyces sp. NPDC021622 TaxID=3155013 RepID=UPI00340CC633